MVDQVFLLPTGTQLTAPAGKSIVTEGPDGVVKAEKMVLPYKGIVVSEGYFLLLMREAMEGRKLPTFDEGVLGEPKAAAQEGADPPGG